MYLSSSMGVPPGDTKRRRGPLPWREAMQLAERRLFDEYSRACAGVSVLEFLGRDATDPIAFWEKVIRWLPKLFEVKRKGEQLVREGRRSQAEIDENLQWQMRHVYPPGYALGTEQQELARAQCALAKARWRAQAAQTPHSAPVNPFPLKGLGFGQAPAMALRPTVVLDRFDFDKSAVKPTHWPGTLSVARTILASEGTSSPIRAVRLVGHTDRTGTESYNQQLGQRRAEAVQHSLRDALNRMRPGSGTRITFSTESRGETQPVSGPAELSRRVEVFLPASPTQDTRPRCANVAAAAAIERAAARQTLTKSASVASRFIRMLGGLDARGRFSPTVLDDKYWFAKLYELITYFEILRADRLQHPAFLLHFIPVFYNMYSDALDDFQNGNLSRVSALWLTHFRTAARPNVGSFSSWQRGVQNSIVTGVRAHIQGDMATALERAYRSYVSKYCLTNVPFDTFRVDFFERNRPVFDEVQASFFTELSRLGPFPVSVEVGQAIIGIGAQVSGGLDLDEVFGWRAAAWAEAKRRLGQ